jgi:hypothetical protein
MDIIQDIGTYTFVTTLDLSMGYYHLRLSEEASMMSTFMVPGGLYRYLRLPMGLNISPDIFQQHMMQLFGDLDFAKCYLDDIDFYEWYIRRSYAQGSHRLTVNDR